MSEVFQSWRRKAGCVLLVMTIALLGTWMRSLALWDAIEFRSFGSYHVLIAEHGRLFWATENQSKVLVNECKHNTLPSSGDVLDRWLSDSIWDKCRWQNQIAVVKYGYLESSINMTQIPRKLRWCQAPFWSLVLPLTLITANLILWPGKRIKPRTTAELQVSN